MKKSVILCMVAVVLISVFVGCSVKNSDVNENAETSSFSASKETTLHISTAENDAKADTTTTAPTANEKTTSTTSNKIELSKTTTKRKVVSTTSKQPTTQKASQCSNNNNHSMKCGNMGRWFDSKSDVKAYVDSVMKFWADKWESGEISDDEYFANCPQGYECWSCGYCGKWSGNFK